MFMWLFFCPQNLAFLFYLRKHQVVLLLKEFLKNKRQIAYMQNFLIQYILNIKPINA